MSRCPTLLSILCLWLLGVLSASAARGHVDQPSPDAEGWLNPPVPAATTSLSHGLLFEPGFSAAGTAPVAAPSRRVPRQLLGNSTTIANATLGEAQRIVLAAQSEAAKRNARLVANVRRNQYEFRSPRQSKGPASPAGDDTATGVDETVAAAAVIVTEALTRNGTFGADGAKSDSPLEARQSGSWWLEAMVQNGESPFAPSGYKVWRNVKDYGARGDGVTDDTAAINKAVADGNRCGLGCGSSTTLQAVVYFPPGTYIISGSIIQYYHTQFIGHVSEAEAVPPPPPATRIIS